MEKSTLKQCLVQQSLIAEGIAKTKLVGKFLMMMMMTMMQMAMMTMLMMLMMTMMTMIHSDDDLKARGLIASKRWSSLNILLFLN